MVYFFQRSGDTRCFETRLQDDGPGYELVVSDGSDLYVERFEELDALIGREKELVRAWRTQGWRSLGPSEERA